YSGRFADVFKRRVGRTPTEYRSHLPAPPRESTADTAPICKTESQLFRVAGILPVPMQIFKQNGDIIFINEAVLGAWNVKDSSRILGTYNLIKDPLVNEQFGLREQIRRTFEGETVLITDIRIPLERFWEWYDPRSAEYDTEAIYTDILNFTVSVEDVKADYVVSIFLTSRLYQGRSDVTRAKEYLENHWREGFDAGRLAGTIGLSPSHLARLFKKQTGITLYSYYQEVKIARLKAALRDQNLSVAEAFLSCGFAYPDNFTRFFKKKVGMTPLEYRKKGKESK
ncbi:MAG TPA: AraC family transcriptional regulator, partial [Feifaniaceae bacterium]|nr:AraC family transcriptional regulator [Feifaniaceae bacterium]